MSRTVAEILADDAGAPPCQDCGVCCQYYKSVGVEETEENFAFLQANDLLRTNEYGEFEMKADKANRCAALRGEVGKKVECSVYENRPNACRQYVAGAGLCQIARVFTFADLTKRK